MPHMSTAYPKIDLTVITPTFRRPNLLALCLYQFSEQRLGGLCCEHLVVSDGPDEAARIVAARHGARFIERPQTGGLKGALAKNDGIAAARGEYVCFWDDDNRYESHALATLYAAAYGCDIGVVRTWHRDGRPRVIPEYWSGTFEF